MAEVNRPKRFASQLDSFLKGTPSKAQMASPSKQPDSIASGAKVWCGDRILPKKGIHGRQGTLGRQVDTLHLAVLPASHQTASRFASKPQICQDPEQAPTWERVRAQSDWGLVWHAVLRY